jgi:hypothetical protein
LQAQDFRGSLIGTVTDTGGARIGDSIIQVRSHESTLERQSISENHGQLRSGDLLPGIYCLTVSAAGFTEARSEVTIIVSSGREISVTLYPASMPQAVNVVAQASSITTQVIDTSALGKNDPVACV